MHENKISAPQFFSLLYLSTLGSVFMYISSSKILIASTDTLLRPLVYIIVGAVVIIPAFLLSSKWGRLGEEKHRELKNSKVYKTVSLVYALVYFADAVITTARFDLFASSELFPGTDMTFFIIALVVCCCALALLGIGGLSRAGTIFTAVVVAATCFASLTLIEEVDLLNFTPAFENGTGKFFLDSLLFSVQASEIGSLLIFMPQIKGDIKKNYALWLVCGAVSFSVIFFFVVGTLGLFADTQLFPTYSAVSLAEFGLFERLDALETAIWILCIVAKLTFYVIIGVKSIRFTVSKVSEKQLAIITAVVISAVITFISYDVKRFGFISSTAVLSVVYAIPVLILPVILLIYTYIKGGKANEKKV